MIRSPRVLSLAAVAMLLAAACGSTAPTAAPTAATSAPATAAPTVAPPTDAPPTEAPPTADASGPDLSGAASALDEIEKYQIDMTLVGLVPQAEGATEITMTGTVDATADAYEFEMSGFSGLGTGDVPIKFIVIGSDAWISLGGTTYLKQPGGGASFDQMREGLAPATLLGQFPTDGAGTTKVGDESKNGMDTAHYHLSAGEVPMFATQFGAEAEMDFWISDAGGYLVSMTMIGEQNGSAVEMSIDLSRINDPTISISEPN